MTNILITGATGFVGSHLTKYLSENSDNNIYGLTRSIKLDSGTSLWKKEKIENKINLFIGDITDYNTINEIINKYDIDKIFHLAAQAIVKTANDLPIETYNTNVIGTMNLLESIRLIKLKYNKEIPTLIMSSDKSYGISKILPYTEDMQLNGLDPYSSSKSCEDIVSRMYAYSFNLPITVVRSCNIYGAYDFNWSRLIPQFVKAYLNNKIITIYKNTSKQKREYIYVDDLVKILTLLISEENIKKTKGQAFNVTSNQLLNVDNVLELFKILTDYNNIVYTDQNKDFKEIPEQYLDNSKLNNTIGNTFKTNFKDGLKLTIDGYKEWFNSKV